MKQSIQLFSVLFLITFTLLASPLVQAAASVSGDEDGEIGYEDIVKDLSKDVSREEKRVSENSSRARARRTGEQSSLDDVMIHGGVGLTQMFGTVGAASRVHLAQQGVQATLGIDLFSNNWMAEGAARNFTARDYDRTAVSLKEFDLKIVYHNTFAPKLQYRLSSGLAARYLKIEGVNGTEDYKTPSSIFAAGADYLLSRTISIGGELATRSALISETADKNTYDMTLRLDANF